MATHKNCWSKYTPKEKRKLILYLLILLFVLVLFLVGDMINNSTLMIWLMLPISIIFVILCAKESYYRLIQTENCLDYSIKNRHKWIKSLTPKWERIFIIVSGWIYLICAVWVAIIIIKYALPII